MEDIMLWFSEARFHGEATNLSPNLRGGSTVFDEPRRRRDGSIDYDFYRARARRLREECVAELMRAMPGHAVRALTGFAQWIVAPIESLTARLRRSTSSCVTPFALASSADGRLAAPAVLCRRRSANVQDIEK
jgi:hypothetical protein